MMVFHGGITPFNEAEKSYREWVISQLSPKGQKWARENPDELDDAIVCGIIQGVRGERW